MKHMTKESLADNSSRLFWQYQIGSTMMVIVSAATALTLENREKNNNVTKENET
jgi:hypothetical protein